MCGDFQKKINFLKKKSPLQTHSCIFYVFCGVSQSSFFYKIQKIPHQESFYELSLVFRSSDTKSVCIFIHCHPRMGGICFNYPLVYFVQTQIIRQQKHALSYDEILFLNNKTTISYDVADINYILSCLES